MLPSRTSILLPLFKKTQILRDLENKVLIFHEKQSYYYEYIQCLWYVFLCVLGELKVSDLLNNKALFVSDVTRYTSIPPQVLNTLLESSLPQSNLQVHDL